MTTQPSEPKPSKFDPMQHLSELKGKPYLEVKWRLAWLRAEHPTALLETEMKTLDEHGAVFMARVVLPNGGAATGWGSCTVKGFSEFIEKAETKAIGRALGALGFGTQFCGDDFEESGPADSPVQPRQQAQRQQVGRDPQQVIEQGKASSVDDLVNAFDGIATMQELNRYVRNNITGKVSDPAVLERCRGAYDKAKARIEGAA